MTHTKVGIGLVLLVDFLPSLAMAEATHLMCNLGQNPSAEELAIDLDTHTVTFEGHADPVSEVTDDRVVWRHGGNVYDRNWQTVVFYSTYTLNRNTGELVRELDPRDVHFGERTSYTCKKARRVL